MTGEASVTAGIDIGAATAKAVIMEGSRILAWHVVPTGAGISQSLESLVTAMRHKTGLSLENMTAVVATGYGRRKVPFAGIVVTELSCHARGVNFLVPQARTVIDIGGQDSKVLTIDTAGTVLSFVMNDKCAAGTGRFLEVMARALDADIDEIGSISLKGTHPCRISSTCTVFAESEMVTLRADGESRENIFAGIHDAMAHRIAVMGGTVGFQGPVVFTGGVAANKGMKQALENKIKETITVPDNPQIAGALGAALIARDRIR